MESKIRKKAKSKTKKINKPARLQKKKQKSRLGDIVEIDEEEKNLEEIVFGTENEIIQKLGKMKKSKKKHRKTLIEELVHKTRRPAWRDDDVDDQQTFVKTGLQNPEWAQLDCQKDESEDDSDEEILKRTGDLLQKSVTLPSGVLEFQRCANLNDEFKNKLPTKCVEFHPSSQVAMVAGYDGTATLFQVDGKTNPKIQSIHFESFPIYSAHFNMTGEEMIVASKTYCFFYYYDMIAGKTIKVPWEKGVGQETMRKFEISPDGRFIVVHGKFGNIHFLSAKTKEWLFTLKMNGGVYSLAFNQDGSRLYSHGDTGQVFVWDVNSRKCLYKFYDEGCIIGTSLAVSPNNKYLVAGSDSGVVNIYNVENVSSQLNPKPAKAIMNLTTQITNLKFNCTSELLAMASGFKENAVKLVHFPSFTAFTNFPTFERSLKLPLALDISLNSGFLTIGNNVGLAYLFRLKHYNNY